MPRSPVPSFQGEIVRRLQSEFSGEAVAAEWEAFPRTGENYSPRLDVAVGPFAHGDAVLISTYDSMAKKHVEFLRRLHRSSSANLSHRPPDESAITLEAALDRNSNARCFLAIEIENSISRKHLMGER